MVKISATGTKEWDKHFGGSKSDGLASLAETADSGYTLAGSSTSGIDGDKLGFSKGMADYWLVKINSTGQMQWNKGFGGLSNEYLRTLVIVLDGYLLAGYSHSGLSGDKSQPSQGESDFWAVKSSLGTFDASIPQLTLYNATTDAFSKQLYTGIVLYFTALGTNQLSILATTKGTIGSVQFKLDGKVIYTENHAPYSIAGDAAKPSSGIDFIPWTPTPGKHTLVMTPFKESNGIGMMGMPHTLRFSVVSSSSRVASQPPYEKGNALSLQVFPNPVADVTTITFSSSAGGSVNLAVYDALGTQLQILHQGPSQSGKTYQYSFSRQGLKPGVYLCRLMVGKQVMNKKIVVR